MKIALLQDGARLHYAVPIALQRAGLLGRVFTDLYARPGFLTRILARALPAIAGRHAAELDRADIHTKPFLTLRSRLDRKNHSTDEAHFAAESERMADWILRRGFGDADGLFGFIRNLSPRLCAEARRRGLRTIGDQIIAPAAVEKAALERQSAAFPGWQKTTSLAGLDTARAVEEATWPELDVITCGSDYVKHGLIAQGVAPGKINVLPYPIDTAHFRVPERTGPPVVGFVGGVNLRKGAPAFSEVARRLHKEARFIMVGPIALTPEAIAKHSSHVELIGPVPRTGIAGWLERFDLFLFPSTCEGSAGAVMEALASGLPTITTPESGTVVREGIEGHVTAPDALDEMEHHLHALIADQTRREAMSRAARQRAEQFNLDWYAGELARVVA